MKNKAPPRYHTPGTVKPKNSTSVGPKKTTKNTIPDQIQRRLKIAEIILLENSDLLAARYTAIIPRKKETTVTGKTVSLYVCNVPKKSSTKPNSDPQILHLLFSFYDLRVKTSAKEVRQSQVCLQPV